MNRLEFIDWLEHSSGFERTNNTFDNEYRELMDYAEYVWDELTVEDDKVIFRWEEWYWGGINYRNRECSFDEFVEMYDNYNLKN
jgi:hypothetical protein